MVHTLLVGRCVTEKRKGVLICYENGHGDLADTVLKTFQHSQIAVVGHGNARNGLHLFYQQTIEISRC